MNYDSWKTTDTTDTLPAPAEVETCDCGQPLKGGKRGLCTDCVREAHEHAADCSDAETEFFLPLPQEPGTWTDPVADYARLFPWGRR